MKFKEQYKRTAGFVTFYFVWLKKTERRKNVNKIG